MTIYQLTQLTVRDLKNKIQNAPTKQEKRRFIYALLLKDVLTVGFAVILISALNSIFTEENSCAAVVIFCILLSVRFVNYGYKVRDSILSMFVVFMLLTFSSPIAFSLPPFLGLIVHIISLFLILFLTCDEPHMGNAGIYVFGYVFFSGFPVYGFTLFLRFVEMLLGFTLCSFVFYRKHKTKQKERSVVDLIYDFRFSNPKYQWQILIVLGVSIILFIGQFFNIPRAMWMGFACGSMLSAYQSNVKERMRDRVIGVILGCTAFTIVYSIFPDSFKGLIGIISGLCLGLCGEYKYCTLFNCFGALLIASGIYGVYGSSVIRVINNIIGCIFGVSIYFIYYKIITNSPVSKTLIKWDEFLHEYFHQKHNKQK